MARIADAKATTSGFSYFIVFTSFPLHVSCPLAGQQTRLRLAISKKVYEERPSDWSLLFFDDLRDHGNIFPKLPKCSRLVSHALNWTGAARLRRPRSLRCRSQHSTWIVRIKAPIGSSSAWRALSNASWNAFVSRIPRWALIIW